MNFYLRTPHTPVPCEIDADALRYWLTRALAPTGQPRPNLAPFLPKNGRPGIIEPALAQRLVKVITAFAMEDDEDEEDERTLAAAKLFQACQHHPVTVSER